MLYSEQEKSLNFTTMTPNIAKKQGEIHPKDYTIHAIRLNLNIARP